MQGMCGERHVSCGDNINCKAVDAEFKASRS